MTSSVIDTAPLFELRSEIEVNCTPDSLYAIVSDLGRSGEWSPECQGGEWVEGRPAALGSIFRGLNLRSEEVVGWAPLIRGNWSTDSKVVAAQPGRTFQWMMLSHAGADQQSIWGFDIRPAGDGGSVLTHHFRMGTATAGIHHIVENLDETERSRFVRDWTDKLRDDLAQTLDRIKNIAEK